MPCFSKGMVSICWFTLALRHPHWEDIRYGFGPSTTLNALSLKRCTYKVVRTKMKNLIKISVEVSRLITVSLCLLFENSYSTLDITRFHTKEAPPSHGDGILFFFYMITYSLYLSVLVVVSLFSVFIGLLILNCYLSAMGRFWRDHCVGLSCSIFCGIGLCFIGLNHAS